ncbi:DUF2808 domain-containing protein [Xenococcus sp. PCC 7305]|uniref:DUF2808 domain-containing protein n=1 Tax=Xenococcus sp. PCC 7305 TaxID=102125 RepID=UPI0002ED04AA|nr:DUF2808 domain-containing protein [Xenococcus sp. PCC 7305]
MNSTLLACVSSPIVILAIAIAGNTLTSNSTIAESNVGETKQTEYIPQVAFRKAPRLVDIYTTFNTVRMRSATYYFDVTIPEDAGAPLHKVAIELRQGQEEIYYKLEKTVAYLGDHRRKGDKLALETVSIDESTGIITVEFTEPLPPDTTFTIGLKPRRNPDYDGIYVFGVTVFPQGENPYGLYLGSRSLTFYSGYDGFFGY